MKYFQASACAALLLCAPASIAAQAPNSLSSASKLTEDEGENDSWTYRDPSAALSKYQRFIIRPTLVNSDPTGRWGSTSSADRQKYAAHMTEALRSEIGKSYEIVDKPGPGVAVMQLTLLGVQTTTSVVATASRLSPMGLALNSVKSLAGKEGSFTGSVHVAFELTDSQNRKLLFAAVRRRSPNALDIEATLSTEKTVEATAEDIATAIRKGLDRANGR